MALEIYPANITEDSVPVVLGAILAKLGQNDEDHSEIKELLKEQSALLKEHDDCLQVLRFSKCTLIPWLGRNKWIVAILVSGLSVWFSTLDWVNRWLQWTFFPPGTGP